MLPGAAMLFQNDLERIAALPSKMVLSIEILVYIVYQPDLFHVKARRSVEMKTIIHIMITSVFGSEILTVSVSVLQYPNIVSRHAPNGHVV